MLICMHFMHKILIICLINNVVMKVKYFRTYIQSNQLE
jgi:hypothetical protein